MPTWVKVVLVVVLVSFAALAVGIVFAARWLKEQGRAVAKNTENTVTEAQQFGKGKDAEACMTEALSRLKPCDGFICEAQTKLFLVNCLEAATVKPEECANVPATKELMQTVRWQRDECAKRGWPGDQRCTRLVQGLQVYCESARP